MKKQSVLSVLILAVFAGAVMTTVISCIGVPMSAPSPPDSVPLPSDPLPPPIPMPHPASMPHQRPRPGTATPFDFDVTYTYRKPDDLVEALIDISNYLEAQGGYLWGNEQQGEFIIGGQSEGYYQVTGDTVTVSLNDLSAPGGRVYNLEFDKPRNINDAIQNLRLGISEKKGTLNGNVQQGSFNASGIAGSYTVTEKIYVTITEKPLLIPISLIEKEIGNWLKGM